MTRQAVIQRIECVRIDQSAIANPECPVVDDPSIEHREQYLCLDGLLDVIQHEQVLIEYDDVGSLPYLDGADHVGLARAASA